jgi:hypothetical protein
MKTIKTMELQVRYSEGAFQCELGELWAVGASAAKTRMDACILREEDVVIIRNTYMCS